MNKQDQPCPAVRIGLLPKDTNAAGNIFGGVILSQIDIAGAIAAQEVHGGRVVTVAMNGVVFKKPVLVGDILTCWTDVTKVGRTSITVMIKVEVSRLNKRSGARQTIQVTEAEAVYVAVNKRGRPIPVGSKSDGQGTRKSSRSTRTNSCQSCSHGPATGTGQTKRKSPTRTRKGKDD